LDQSENLVLGEVDRVFGILNKKTDLLQKDVQEMKQYYHIIMLEQDNTKLALQRMFSFTERVEALERAAAL